MASTLLERSDTKVAPRVVQNRPVQRQSTPQQNRTQPTQSKMTPTPLAQQYASIQALRADLKVLDAHLAVYQAKAQLQQVVQEYQAGRVQSEKVNQQKKDSIPLTQQYAALMKVATATITMQQAMLRLQQAMLERLQMQQRAQTNQQSQAKTQPQTRQPNAATRDSQPVSRQQPTTQGQMTRQQPRTQEEPMQGQSTPARQQRGKKKGQMVKNALLLTAGTLLLGTPGTLLAAYVIYKQNQKTASRDQNRPQQIQQSQQQNRQRSSDQRREQQIAQQELDLDFEPSQSKGKIRSMIDGIKERRAERKSIKQERGSKLRGMLEKSKSTIGRVNPLRKDQERAM
ncbi:hypothetical protein SAMN05444392_10825 [Seinonella peptonophila]|uniref:Uncharacterized protein n=1 Tax=Seinonella peptonophila TaxID=112248 RepID=A0A1M4Z4W3_9BACL|nr:hypothetical protein [Seinonella peptonophila]SHF12762.1 hypothetical protein SAMN05444392_10825 [Seinonella peptonophila]